MFFAAGTRFPSLTKFKMKTGRLSCDVAGVGCGVARGDDHFGGVGGIRRPVGIRLAGDPGIDFAVLRTHGEAVHGPGWIIGGHLRGPVMGRADDEIAIGIRGGDGAVGQFGGGDKSRGSGIAGGRRDTGRRGGHPRQQIQ